jgi:uncharacterized protein (TIGR00369 family)
MSCNAKELTDDVIVSLLNQMSDKGGPTPAYQGKLTSANREHQTLTMVYSGITAESGLTHDGIVQGGILCGLIDEACAVLAFFLSKLALAPATLEVKTSFLRPCPPGKLRAEIQAVKMGKTIGFFEGSLFDSSGKEVARASTTLNLRPNPMRDTMLLKLATT